MTSAQRVLLVLIVLLAGGAVAGALLWTGTTPAGPDEPGVERGPDAVDPARGTAGPTPPAQLVGEVTTRTERIGAANAPAGELELRVIDEAGKPLEEALVKLTGPEGLEVEAQGSNSWTSFATGTWQVEAEYPKLIPHREEFVVEEGKRTRLVVQLHDNLTIRGTIVDRFGHGPGRSVPVWFHRRGKTHPADYKTARGAIGIATDVAGQFEIQLKHAGRYRVSVGPPGEPLAEQIEPVELFGGGPTRLEVVLSASSRLEVVLENPPPAVAEGTSNLQVGVLVASGEARRKRTIGLPVGATDKPHGGRKERRNLVKNRNEGGEDTRERQAGTRARGTEDAGQDEDTVQEHGAVEDVDVADDGLAEISEGFEEPLDPDPAAPRANAEGEWVERDVQRVPPSGRLVLNGLPSDEEVRLILRRRNDTFHSRPILLPLDRSAVARFSVPARREPAEIQAQPIGELLVSVLMQAPPPDAPEPGFTWR